LFAKSEAIQSRLTCDFGTCGEINGANALVNDNRRPFVSFAGQNGIAAIKR
jgi:hypothetical protein